MNEPRLPLAPVLEHYKSQSDLARAAGVDRRQVRRWLDDGLPAGLSDALALGCGVLHPIELWPDWHEVMEAWEDHRARLRQRQGRVYKTPARYRARRRAYYREKREAELARRRAYYEAHREWEITRNAVYKQRRRRLERVAADSDDLVVEEAS